MKSISSFASPRFAARILLFVLCTSGLASVAEAASAFAGSYRGVVVYNVKKYIAGKKVSDKTTNGHGRCTVSQSQTFTLTGFHITKAQHGTVSASGTLSKTQNLIGHGKINGAVINYTGFVSSGGSDRTVQTWKFQRLVKQV